MLGTQKVPFIRMLKQIEELILVFNIKDEVVVQVGNTHYRSTYFKSFDYVGESELDEYINKAKVIITHAGAASVFKSIMMGKKVIVVARKKEYGEMIDNHQLELVKKLSEDGYVLDGSDSIIEAWKLLEKFVPRKYDFTNHIHLNIKKYLDNNIIAPSISQIKDSIPKSV